jgi:nitroreductase
MDILNLLEFRRSIRHFKPDEIRDEIIQDILYAATLAPSAKNRQPWHFTVVRSIEKKKEMISAMEIGIHTLHEHYQKQNIRRPDIIAALGTVNIMKQAPFTVFVTLKKKYDTVYRDNVNWNLHTIDIEAADIQSIGAAIQNMILYAESIQIGSLWICDFFYAYQEIISFLDTKNPIVAAVSFGYHENNRRNPKRELVENVSKFI